MILPAFDQLWISILLASFQKSGQYDVKAVRINSLKCLFVGLAKYFDFTNVITENKDSHQSVVLKTESSPSLVFLSSGYLCSVTCCQNSTAEWHVSKFF